ncbi:hypothetical protein DWG24_16490 [Dickeya zeae]|uniref:Tyr recombinase domain-containing protein n=1 Tax=Dickeya zeae TaxID=204042 RepID=A0AAE6Z1L0_9GAMM|nr:UvrD-helicase domain-containing protein [Dickeya zeae]QIZ52232.1 hypothetical protein DWG24_16490 [Dickeya zeae]
MSYMNTDEQEAVIHWKGRHLVVNAFAGTGKTSTLVRYALANPDTKMLYLAYNRAVRDEAERKFPFNVDCKTSHQLAWMQFGKHFKNRLTGNLRITDIARKLNTRHWALARTVLSALNHFLCSASAAPGYDHLPDEDERDGLDAEKILGAVQFLWNEMSRMDSTFPVTHDTYLKLFQLSSPDLSKRWDTILFDEAQDANPVTSALVLGQNCNVVLVGDRHQQIYRFRGADNALQDINLDEGFIELRLEGSKTHREWRVPVVRQLRVRLARLLAQAKLAGARPFDMLFDVNRFAPSRRHQDEYQYDETQALQSTRSFFRRLARDCGFAVTAHRFRHTLATELMKTPDRNLQLVKDLLGHSSVSTTMEYIELNMEIVGRTLETELALHTDICVDNQLHDLTVM